jgi:hypothetical protein
MKKPLQRVNITNPVIAAAALALALSGCIAHRGEPGSVDRKFTVSGPVRLELTNSNGDSKVIAGTPGEVSIHANFEVKSWSEHGARQRIAEMQTSPPFSQEGNLIHVGGFGSHMSGVTINYSIIVPPDTEIHATTASGNVQVSGVRGPVFATSGSGDISLVSVTGDVQVRSGSGTIQLASIQGHVQAMTGSGELALASVRGDARVQTGSGSIQIAKPVGSVVANSGSGSINVANATEDLRAVTSSGNITVTGDPPSAGYWDFRTSSGNVALQVSPEAGFRFYAKTKSGNIDSAIPVTMEGTAGKHVLRARIGGGKGRVEVETSSGNVALH